MRASEDVHQRLAGTIKVSRSTQRNSVRRVTAVAVRVRNASFLRAHAQSKCRREAVRGVLS